MLDSYDISKHFHMHSHTHRHRWQCIIINNKKTEVSNAFLHTLVKVEIVILFLDKKRKYCSQIYWMYGMS